jgi:polyphosphate kinase 2 (PPK2 family)
MLQTHRPQAPWYIIPANHKWYRDWAVMTILVRTLGRMNPQFPPSRIDPATVHID